jgi:NAD(P)-dependent dehydrogenase (short-subunit alcohol dehydrogenase family)
VLIHYRDSEADAAKLEGELNALRARSAAKVKAELLAPIAPKALVSGALESFGRLDILVNNASTFFPVEVGAMESSHWEELIGSNLRAPLFISQQAAPELAKNDGSIVNIVDIHAERPLKGYALYSVAKAGLAALTRSLAIELAPRVRVNGVAPGAIAWPEDGQFPEPSASASSPPRRSARPARRGHRAARWLSSPARRTSPGRSSRSTAAARCSSRKACPYESPDRPPARDPRKADYEAGKLAKRLRRQVGEAIADFGMIEEGDKVMVCLSGGKDSHALLEMLLALQARRRCGFELIAVNLDQKQPGFPAHVLPEYLEARGVPFQIVEQDTYSIVKRVMPGRQDHVLAVLAAAARRAVPRGGRARRDARSRSATIATTSWRPSSSICSTAGS